MSIIPRCFEAALAVQEWALRKSPLLFEICTESMAMHARLTCMAMDLLGEENPEEVLGIVAKTVTAHLEALGAPRCREMVFRAYAPYLIREIKEDVAAQVGRYIKMNLEKARVVDAGLLD